MEADATDVLKQTWPELGYYEAGLDRRLFEDGPSEGKEIKEEKNQENKCEGNQLPTINEELAKIFPESAHKFLKKKPTGKRGRPRKQPKIPVQKTVNRGRGRARKVKSSELAASLPRVPKGHGKVGRPRKVPRTEMQVEEPVEGPVKETDMEEDITEAQKREWSFESNVEREKLRKRPRLSYVDAYVDEDENEAEDMEGEDIGENMERDIEREDNNNDVSDASFEESHSEPESYDESESGFESDNPAYVEKKEQKHRKEMDFLEEELPKYRILKDNQGNQAGLSRYQILKVRLLKFQATKGRGRPPGPNKLKIAGAKRGRGRPRKDEMQKRTLKVSLERLSDLHIDSRSRSVKGLKKQGQAYLLSQYNGLKRKRGRPRKVRVETDTKAACGISSASLETSQEQSLEPSLEPSLDPSLEPSLDPSLDQSLEPSLEPSLDPSLDQSLEPSLDPSNIKSESLSECEESKQSLLDSDIESKKEKKKKKKKRRRSDSISRMTSVSVSVQRLENVFDLELLQDTKSIKIKEDHEDMYEKQESIDVCERQEAEDIGIKQDIEDFSVKEEVDPETDEEIVESHMTDIQTEADLLTDTQNYYLNQEVVSPTLAPTKRGRPPKHDHIKFEKKKIGRSPKEASSTKRGRGRPRKHPEQTQVVVSDSVTPYMGYPEKQRGVGRGRGRPRGSSMVKRSFPGRPRGRPKGRKNKQLEYERLLTDMEYVETHSVKQESIKTDDDGGDSVRAHDDYHVPTHTSKSDTDQTSYQSVSKQCTFADDRRELPMNVSSDHSDYVVEMNESDINSPRNIFNDTDTDDEDGGKLITNQSVFQPFSIKTVSKTVASIVFPVMTGSETLDSGPLPVETDSKAVSNVFSHQSHSEFEISEKPLEENQSSVVQEFKSSDSPGKNSQEDQSEKYSLETNEPSDSSLQVENNESVLGSKLEASIDFDYCLNVKSDQSGANFQEIFSGGLLDNTASSDPDFIDDDYLLAF
ncbi:uncharacterized protein LOC123528669 isoform X2 [Mercenaria mercenaria]|uniref:uncharacterized protein LOC123528669 isoform X2 n=1 Tax=Mercenaria mercenaria TaxID=6596 RepID=UPI00234E9089|nr:uncharacterized protein LOC123528669 isoform X2 [Mercenaria mercenaria]